MIPTERLWEVHTGRLATLVGAAVVASAGATVVAALTGGGPLVEVAAFVLVGGVVLGAVKRRQFGRWTRTADRVVGERPPLGVLGGLPTIEVDAEGQTVRVERTSTLEAAPDDGTASVDGLDGVTTVFSTPIDGEFAGEFEVLGHWQPGRDREWRTLDTGDDRYAVRAADEAVPAAVVTPAVEAALDDLPAVGVLTVNGYAGEVRHVLETPVSDPGEVAHNATAVARLARAAAAAEVFRDGSSRDPTPGSRGNRDSEAL